VPQNTDAYGSTSLAYGSTSLLVLQLVLPVIRFYIKSRQKALKHVLEFKNFPINRIDQNVLKIQMRYKIDTSKLWIQAKKANNYKIRNRGLRTPDQAPIDQNVLNNPNEI
jgi:hypothetical protein